MPTIESDIRSIGGDFNDIISFEDATDYDLPASGNIERGFTYADSDFIEAVTFDALGSDVNFYREVTAAIGHEFDPRNFTGTNWYATGGFDRTCRLNENSLRIGFMRIGQEGGDRETVDLNGQSGVLQSLFVEKQIGNINVAVNRGSAGESILRNIIVIGSGSAGISDNTSNRISNCVVLASGFTTGLTSTSPGSVVENCISMGAINQDLAFGGSTTHNNNISQDNTADGTGSHSGILPNDVFQDPANNDFRILEGSVAEFGGIDLSAFFAESFIRGVNHGTAGDWNIGAFEGNSSELSKIQVLILT